jgi:hypothetical protein
MSENFNFETRNLPHAYGFRAENGAIIQIQESCYQLLAPCFLGNGVNATFYDEGEVVKTTACPNHHMQPLNKAAGERYERWLETQVVDHGVRVSVEDLVQAAATLASTKSAEEIAKLDSESWTKAVHKLAVLIGKKRNEQLYGGLRLPDMADPATRVGQTKSPPMAGLHYVDPALRGPAQVGPRENLFAGSRPEPTTSRMKGKPTMAGTTGGPQPAST